MMNKSSLTRMSKLKGAEYDEDADLPSSALSPDYREDVRAHARFAATSPSPLPSITSSQGGVTSRTATPASMEQNQIQAAFRDRIRSRIKTNNMKAKTSSLSRQDNTALLQDSDSLVDELLERREARLRWKSSLKQIITSREQSTEDAPPQESVLSKQFSFIGDEAYDFFTKTDWTDNDRQSAAKSVGDENTGNEKDEENVQSKSGDILAVSSDGQLSVMVRQSAQYKWDDKTNLLFYHPDPKQCIDTDPAVGTDKLDEHVLKQQFAASEPIALRLEREGQDIAKWMAAHEKINIERSHKPRAAQILLDEYNEGETPSTKLASTLTLDELSRACAPDRHDCQINLNSISFSQHPLSNDELLLAYQLKDVFTRYEAILKSNAIENFIKRENELYMKIKQSDSNDTDRDLDRMKNEIIEVSREMARQIVLVRNSLLSLLNFWEAMESLRSRQGYVSSNMSLKYSEITHIKPKEEQKKLTNQISRRNEIERWAAQKMYETLQDQYRKDLRRWKQSQKSRSAEKAHQDEFITKPTPPPEPSELGKSLKEIELETFLSDGRLPGEPKLVNISLETLPVESLTSSDRSSTDEQARTAELRRRLYSLKVYKNGHLIRKTVPKSLERGELRVDLSEETPFTLPTIWKSSYTDEIIIKLFERIDRPSGGKVEGKRRRLCKVYLPPLQLDYVSYYTGNRWKSESGSTHEVKIVEFSHVSPQWGCFSGHIQMTVSCQLNENATIVTPLVVGLEDNLKSLHDDESRMAVIKQIISHVSPVDEEMEEVLRDLKELQTCDSQGDGFRLEPIMEDFYEFGTAESVATNRRFQLLRLRASGHPAFKSIKFIPLEERFIPKNLIQMRLSAYEAELLERERSELSGDVKRKQIQEKRARIVEILLQSRERSTTPEQLIAPVPVVDVEAPRQWEDMIFEYEPPDEGTNALYLIAMMKSTRPLHPTRRERKKPTKPKEQGTFLTPTEMISQYP